MHLFLKTDYDDIDPNDKIFRERLDLSYNNLTILLKAILIITVCAACTNIDFRVCLLAEVGYSLLLYLCVYHRKIHLPYIGGYFCIWLSFIELCFIECDVRPTNSSVGVWAITLPWMGVAALQQACLNWKVKALFFTCSRVILLINY
jgi:hypothetical protein